VIVSSAQCRAIRDNPEVSRWRKGARSIHAEHLERPTGSHHDGPDSELISQQNGETMAAADVPQHHEMLWPTLQAVAELGGSASIGEIVETVSKREDFSNAQQAVLHNNGPETEIGYRATAVQIEYSSRRGPAACVMAA
jgi:hypothetical protein